MRLKRRQKEIFVILYTGRKEELLTMLNDTNQTTTIAGSQDSIPTNLSGPAHTGSSLFEIIAECNKRGTPTSRLPLQILLLVLALPLNVALLWLLLKNRRALSPSEVLGLNLAVLGILYCVGIPLDIYITVRSRSGLLLRISHTFSILCYFGCPLLLSSMCIERYVAASHPVVFMQLGKWEYRAACSALIWLLTVIMAVAAYIYTIAIMALALSFILNILFFLMLACLLGIVWVLCKKGPGAEMPGDQRRDSSMKKRAVKNILAVMVPSTITYLPVLGLAPFLLMLESVGRQGLNGLLCNVLEIFGVLPNFGLCIGPVFYVSRASQLLCCRNNDAGDSRETTAGNRRN